MSNNLEVKNEMKICDDIKALPTSEFDARLVEEIEERLEFYGWTISLTYKF